MKRFIPLVVITILIGCSNSASLHNSDAKISRASVKSITGVYHNLPSDSNAHVSLWNMFQPFYPLEKYKVGHLNQEQVRVELIGERLLKISLIIDGNLLDTKQVKFRKEGNVLVISGHSNSSTEGLPPMIYRNYYLNLNLGVDLNGNLIVAYKGAATGGILFMMVGDKKRGQNIYTKINQ